jgi:uncharacterized cupredoxin-like copper-binding protein
MSFGKIALFAISAVALIALASCSSPTATPLPTPLPIATMQPGAHAGQAQSNPTVANARMIMMDAREFAFSPKQIRVRAGEATTIMFINDGELDHDLRIDAVNFHAHAEPNRSVEASFVGPAKGEYEIYCGISGHKEAGMVSQLIVE